MRAMHVQRGLISLIALVLKKVILTLLTVSFSPYDVFVSSENSTVGQKWTMVNRPGIACAAGCWSNAQGAYQSPTQ